MGRDYSNMNSDVLNNTSNGFDAAQIEYYDECLKNRINSLRKKGYSEDDILLLLFENGCRSKSDSIDIDSANQKSESKCYTYTSDFNKK